MKKRILSMLLALIMVLGLIPVNAFAAGKTVSQYFDGLPVTADPGTGTTAWKVGTKDGQEVLLSGSAGKSHSTSTLTLTFTEDSHLSFAYKVSSEARYDKCTIKLGSKILVDGESGEQDWKDLGVDAKKGDKLTVEYKKDSSGDKNDDCVYLRGFSAGEALVVTFHANNGTEDTATQKIFGGKGTLMANPFTCAGKVFAGWFADQAYTTPADLDQVTQDTTIYAKYVSDSYLDLNYSRIGLFRLRGVTLISAVDNPANYQASGFIVGDQKVDASYASRYRIFKTPANLFGAARDAKLMLADKSLSGTGDLEVTPYWITLDGTEVHGVTHTLHYNTRTIWE